MAATTFTHSHIPTLAYSSILSKHTLHTTSTTNPAPTSMATTIALSPSSVPTPSTSTSSTATASAPSPLPYILIASSILLLTLLILGIVLYRRRHRRPKLKRLNSTASWAGRAAGIQLERGLPDPPSFDGRFSYYSSTGESYYFDGGGGSGVDGQEKSRAGDGYKVSSPDIFLLSGLGSSSNLLHKSAFKSSSSSACTESTYMPSEPSHAYTVHHTLPTLSSTGTGMLSHLPSPTLSSVHHYINRQASITASNSNSNSGPSFLPDHPHPSPFKPTRELTRTIYSPTPAPSNPPPRIPSLTAHIDAFSSIGSAMLAPSPSPPKPRSILPYTSSPAQHSQSHFSPDTPTFISAPRFSIGQFYSSYTGAGAGGRGERRSAWFGGGARAI